MINFAAAASQHRAFAQELPQFISEVRRMFTPEEIAAQLTRIERERNEMDEGQPGDVQRGSRGAAISPGYQFHPEGPQEVKAGDLLIELDARPFQAVLDQANATLARDEANLKNAQVDLARYAQLLQHNNAPEQQYATQQATVAQDEATVKNDQAAIDAAKLNVEYASIRSPIDGIVGIRQIDIGNLVQANSQPLVVITQIKPIYVIFSLPEADIPRTSRRSGGPQAHRPSL